MGKLTRSVGRQILSRQHCNITMAFITVENKAEVSMVKFLSSMNQILLIHCFIMMLLGNLFIKETEVNLFEEGDDDESFLMERADSLTNLLPCLAILTMGAVVVAGSGRRCQFGI